MPRPASSHSNRSHRHNTIGRLDFDEERQRTRTKSLRSSDSNAEGARLLGETANGEETFLERVVDGIVANDKAQFRKDVLRYLSYASAMFSCLAVGSLTTFSIYGHLFISRLHYSAVQVNTISIAMELAVYFPVPLLGWLVDRFSPLPISFLAALFFPAGYLLAAFVYKHGTEQGRTPWPMPVMVLAFIFIGIGTGSMYIAALTACVKNFANSRLKSIATVLPIAAFGLSGVWLSQVGSRVLYEVRTDGSKGDVDVFKYFVFLAILLGAAGLIGSVCQRVVGEEALVEEAVEDLTQSGLLEDSPFFAGGTRPNSYGTVPDEQPIETEADLKRLVQQKETKRFLADPTMWALAAGFFLVTGAVETYQNNIGSMLDAIYAPPEHPPSSNNAAAHVTAYSIFSTFSRLLVGALCDLFAPAANPPLRSAAASVASFSSNLTKSSSFTISRVTLLLLSVLPALLGYILLALPLTLQVPRLALFVTIGVGFTNGTIYTLVPLIISTVWGPQNFGTNWGIVAMFPAIGALVWSMIFGIVYQANTAPGDDQRCWGWLCYGPVSIAWTVCLLACLVCWTWAWRGRLGWRVRGIAV